MTEISLSPTSLACTDHYSFPYFPILLSGPSRTQADPAYPTFSTGISPVPAGRVTLSLYGTKSAVIKQQSAIGHLPSAIYHLPSTIYLWSIPTIAWLFMVALMGTSLEVEKQATHPSLQLPGLSCSNTSPRYSSPFLLVSPLDSMFEAFHPLVHVPVRSKTASARRGGS